MKWISNPSAKVLTFVACGLFLVSALFPFYTATYGLGPEEDRCRVTYWSFKATIAYERIGYVWTVWKIETVLFSNYWFAQRTPYSPTPSEVGVSWALVTLFFAQILTLIVGLVSPFLKKWKLQIIPVISSLLVILLMIYVQVGKWWGRIFSHELGYWLTYLPTLLYLLAFILRFASAHRENVIKE